MMKFKLKKDKIVYYLLVLTILVDAINGLVMNEFHLNNSIIGMWYRAVIIIYFTIVSIKYSYKNMVLFIFILLYFILNITFSYIFYHNNVNGIIFDIVEIMRLSLSMIITTGLVIYLKKNKLNREILKSIIYDSIKILCIIYILAYLIGIGNNTYGNVGYKSVFNANNGLNITLIIFFIFQAEKISQDKNKKDIVYVVLLVIILVLLGSKSSFIFLGLYFLIKSTFKNNIFKGIFYALLYTLILSVICFCIYCLFKKQIDNILARQIYFFHREENKSMITFFLSGRNEFLKASWQYFYKNLSINNLLFGIGSYNNKLNTARILFIYSFKGIEMDFFDILFSYGIIGIIITYGFCLKIYLKNRKHLLKEKKYAEIISFISIMIFSITGGHVFTDAMASTYLGIVLALLIPINKESNAYRGE